MAVWSSGVWAAGVWAAGVWEDAASPLPPVFSGTILDRQLVVDQPMTSIFLADYFDPDPDSYSQIAGTLPAGISLNAATGVISGTPTAAGTAAGLQFRGTNADGSDDTNVFALNVVAELEIVPSNRVVQVAGYVRVAEVRNFDRIMVVEG